MPHRVLEAPFGSCPHPESAQRNAAPFTQLDANDGEDIFAPSKVLLRNACGTRNGAGRRLRSGAKSRSSPGRDELTYLLQAPEIFERVLPEGND